MQAIKATTIGLCVLLVGCLLVYFGEPWLEAQGSPEDWRIGEGSPRGFAMFGLLFTFGIAGYASARVARRHEFRWGVLWSVAALVFMLAVAWCDSESIRWRFPVPRLDMGWLGVLLFVFYCVAPICGASAAEDKNKKRKPDTAEVVAETTHDVIDIIHELFKHRH
jgi:hypothetical protein